MILVNVDTSDIARMLSAITTAFYTNAVPVAANVLREEIGSDARKGRGYNGQKWQAYTDGYKKVRRRLGRPTAPVDLRIKDTDSYLDRLQTQGNWFVPAPGDEKRAEGLEAKRPHIGASQRAERRIGAEMEKVIGRVP